ncbi:MAG: fumarylacetoacetate hydrolase family protein [Thermodesulfobacteriota bacterium]|nr:fumarylacetoacetate hydrolase family protein [Thermodesulfobacteriota bacterium]|tara:strand:+ start:529 stop:1173 length:645 start_codon:yes stop_codon:yes gene_type:complete
MIYKGFSEIGYPTKIIAIGLNYHDHAEEMKKKPPAEPLMFLKPPSSLIAWNEDIIYPNHMSSRVDYEGELGIVIKKEAKWVSVNEAQNYILGGLCVNDVTARDLQSLDIQFSRAKGFDTFCPVGPSVSDEIDYQNVKIKTIVNGETKQESSTSNMVHSVNFLISFISKIMTLNRGDLILTGTPGGIGQLKDKDIVSVNIEGLEGTRNKVSLRIK